MHSQDNGGRRPTQGASRHTHIDLETVRDTLALIHEDLRRDPELDRVRRALVAAVEEISAVEAARAPQQTGGPSPGRMLPFPTSPGRFVPWVAPPKGSAR